MRSPLEITYDEVVANPGICRDNPMGRPDWNGNVTLWEGRQNAKDLRSPIFRVVLTKSGVYEFYKFDKRYNEWRKIPALEPRRFFRRKNDKVPKGRVRVEVFANGRVKRTVG